MCYILICGQVLVLIFEEVMMIGLVCDGGLYVFEIVLMFSVDEVEDMVGKFYEDIVFVVMCLFLGDIFIDDEFCDLIFKVYVGFGYDVCVLLVQLVLNYFLLELFYGLMLVFKDFVMQIIGQMM